MSKSTIPQNITNLLWAKSAGRCQYEGCNKILYEDGLTRRAYNKAYIAHIIADSEDGPRGDKELSPKLCKDINNLMLLCDEHHRLIDKVDVDSHTVEVLTEMKKKHEERIELVAGIDHDKKTNIVIYSANIGKNKSLINYNRASLAIIPERYPADKHEIDLSINADSFKDNEDNYWNIQSEHLIKIFNEKIKQKFNYNVQHYSLFALAPQPLLIKLGCLLSDLYNVDVYQLHREPSTWKWLDNEEIDYIINNNNIDSNIVAINFSLSANIDNLRINKVLGEKVNIWTFKINNPNNDFLKGRKQLELFRIELRKLLNEIKLSNNEYTEINIFAAMPVSAAVELGRVWMPKADLNLKIYDENRELGGFVHALTISNNKE